MIASRKDPATKGKGISSLEFKRQVVEALPSGKRDFKMVRAI